MSCHNILPAFINDHYCEMFVDCGITSVIMKYQVAKRLGLLQLATHSKTVQLQLWTKKVIVVVQVLEAVTVRLFGGVSFPCIFLVGPKHCPINSLESEIFLDSATLCTNHVIQRIFPASSTLFFPNPLPKWTPRVSPDTIYELANTHFRKGLEESQVRVLVDTGARFLYCSNKYLTAPVHLVVAEGVELFAGIMWVCPTTYYDFIIGTKLLSRYNCVLDFSNQYLYFHTENNGVYRAQLTSRTLT